MNQQILDKLSHLIKLYGLQALEKMIFIIRPMLPAFITNEQLIPIVVALSGVILPMTAGSALLALDILTRVSLFGVSAGVGTVKATYSVAKTTAQVATEVLIKKPIYFLSYPFRRHSEDKQIQQMLELCKLQQKELQQYKKTYSQVGSQPDKIFLIIRQLTNSREEEKDIKAMVGSLERNDRVERLLPLIRKHNKEVDRDSIQLICNRSIVRLDAKLSTLPRNDFGAVEVYYVMLETFG